MAWINRHISISKMFARYIVLFCVITALLIGTNYVVLFEAINAGLVLPANYYEHSIEKQRSEISKADKVKDIIPVGCGYAVYDTNGNVTESNVSQKKASDMLSRIRSNKTVNGNTVYRDIQRKDGICIVKYRLSADFENKTLRKYFPNFEIIYNYAFVLLFILEIIILSKSFRKKLSKEMDILKQITEKVAMENLDFNVQYSNIKEINEVISALDKMKEELSVSLKKQWKMDESRKNQISALAHDIKTPLTIIKGNSELLGELDLTDEQKEYNDSIIKESDSIEFYIKSLIEINKSQQAQELIMEEINSNEFVNDIAKQAQFMCLNKNIEYSTDVNKDVVASFNGDISCIKRAVMNVLSNAVQYTPKRGKIIFSVYSDENYIYFIVEDCGKGFSEEEIQSATDEFYQGDKSRTSKNHYGMGLYIAKTFIEKHDGNIKLSNSEKLGGAKVTLKLSVD